MRFRIAPYSTRVFAACLALAAALLGAHAWAAERVLFHHDDAVGSPVAMTDSTGAVVWGADYEPFGGVVEESGTASTTHRFTGKERDVETGLDYFGARYYDARIGRFLSVDPLLDIDAAAGAPQRWNRFAYALNSPFRYGDPDGRDAVILNGGFIGGEPGVRTLADTVRTFFPPRKRDAIPRAVGPGRRGYGGACTRSRGPVCSSPRNMSTRASHGYSLDGAWAVTLHWMRALRTGAARGICAWLSEPLSPRTFCGASIGRRKLPTWS
ncbi:MAG TPA: RHS repeat-associated core domain-containing protein [Thermodesulfobacteriota bacterium]